MSILKALELSQRFESVKAQLQGCTHADAVEGEHAWCLCEEINPGLGITSSVISCQFCGFVPTEPERV